MLQSGEHTLAKRIGTKPIVDFIDRSIDRHTCLPATAHDGKNLNVTVGDDLVNKNIMFWNAKNKQFETALVTKYNPSTSFFTLGKPNIKTDIPTYKGKCKKLHLLVKHATSNLKVLIGGTWVTTAFRTPDFVPRPKITLGRASATASSPRRLKRRGDATDA